MLTTIRDIDELIFLYLPDKDILRLCQLSKEMNRWSTDERFWEKRSKMRFTALSPYKPKSFSWKAFYELHASDPLLLRMQYPKNELLIKRIYDSDYMINMQDLTPLFPMVRFRPPKNGDILSICLKRITNHYILHGDYPYILNCFTKEEKSVVLIHFPIAAIGEGGIRVYSDYFRSYFDHIPTLKSIHIKIEECGTFSTTDGIHYKRL